MAAISATHQRILSASPRMKNPIIIIASRLAGEGSPSPMTVLIQPKRRPDG